MLVTPAIAAAMRATQQVAGVTIVYTRAEVSSEEIPATVGRTMYEKENGGGVYVKSQTRDYLVAAAKLMIGGNAIVPEKGDKITEYVGTQEFVYEVIPLDRNPWRYLDPDRSYYRIHTQHVATV